MVGVKSGALNFSKMLRTLEHRTNQVKDFNFLRKPLQRPSKASTKDINKELPLRLLDFNNQQSFLEKILNQFLGKISISDRLGLDGLVSLWQPDLR